jgi:protein tyrosine phosphatase (PTP) superfamily phosphohydrolase (DUF442 family)
VKYTQPVFLVAICALLVTTAILDARDQEITIGPATSIYVRMIDSISSDQNQAGQVFRGSLDHPVRIGRRTVLPEGAAYVKLLEARSAGRVKGRSELRLMLEGIEVADQRYSVASNVVEFSGKSEGKKTGKSAGVGALFGGGKGAAVGAGVGAGTEVATSAPKKGAEVRFGQLALDDFGKLNDNYYRGGQPKREDYARLAALGIRTVVDLRQDGPDDEQRLVENAGMTFYSIPMTASYPPSEFVIHRFLQLVNDPANQPVFVHCEHGHIRTGLTTAVYRITHDGWTADQAYAEMKKYHFHSFRHDALKRRHGLKQFVYRYHDSIHPISVLPKAES